MWEFLKFLFLFWFNRREKAEERRKKKLQKVKTKLDKKFKEIDDKKNNERERDLEDRLNSMFD